MENENQNTITPQAGSPTGDLQAYMSQMRRKRNRNMLIGMLVAVCLGVFGYFAYKNPQLFKAEILPVEELPAGADKLYIPSYTAGAGDTGTISIKSNVDFSAQSEDKFDVIGFTLNYSPSTALSFEDTPFVLSADTKIQSASLKLADSSTPGKLSVLIVSSSPITPSAGDVIFKLNTKINPAIAANQEITLSVQDMQVMNGNTQLTTIGAMAAGTITVGGGNELKVLNAEATDSTHVIVHFSDYLNQGNIGALTDYIIPDLTVSAVAPGADQQSVVLTTSDQNGAEDYVLTVANITGNMQGGLKSGFQSVLFYGYGAPATALSDFSITGAMADNYTQLTVTFSHNVAAGSVNAGDFTLININTGASPALSAPTVATNKVTFTVSDKLLKKYTYLLSVNPNTVRRATDNVYIGINKTAFTGFDNGPKILTANAASNTVTITFDRNIQRAGLGSNSIGQLYVVDKGTLTALNDSYLINDAVLTGFSQAVSGKTITLTNAMFAEPNAHFIFSVSNTAWITDASGVGTDSAYKTISFWGAGHTSAVTTGNVTVINKNTVKIAPGTLDFALLSANNVCSAFTTETTCEAVTGCSFACGGAASCANLNQIMCPAKGCAWNPTLSACTGTLACAGRPSAQCGLINGCIWGGSACTGTPTCSASLNPTACSETGCSSGCTGTPASTGNKVAVMYDNGTTLQNAQISSVQIAGTDLQISFTNNLQSDRHYVLSITDADGKILTTKRFVAEQGLNVTAAQATASNKVKVTFSENIDGATVDKDDFALTPAATVSNVSIDDYTNVTLTTAAMSPSTVYSVTAFDNNPADNASDDIYAWAGKGLGKNTAVFPSSEAAAEISDVTLSSVNTVSSTKVRLTFSGAVKADTLTPVNIKFKYSPFGDTDKLTIASNPPITHISGNTYELTTSAQDANKNYFVVMNGVQDAGGLILGNNKVLNFFKFLLQAPRITLVSPKTITNDADQTVTITGENLAAIQRVRVGSQDVTIVNQSATSVTIIVPANIEAKTYDITLTDSESISKTFANSLFVNEPVTQIQIVSEESQAMPANVANDGEMKTVLHVRLRGPDLANITSVLVDLSQIGGLPAQVMTKDPTPQPQYTQWYTYEVTGIPPTVSTSTKPYLLPVEAHKGTEIFKGTVSIMVTKDVLKSVPPTIDQVYVSPVSVSPDGKTPVKISAKVTDMDGAYTITSVVADMGTLGIGFVNLSAIEAGTGAELTTKFYQSEEFTVASTTQVGAYTINVTASDLTGESVTKPLTLNVSTQLTGPSISATKSYVSPRKSIPNDEKTAFALNVYVTDPDGIADVTNVTASFGTMGLAPVTLIKDPNAPETSKSAFFSAGNLTIPKTSPLGVQAIEITAEDTTGGLANYVIQIDVTAKDLLGDAPMIIQDKGYTTPKVAINDGATPITLYVFVRDDDDNIESVVANLKQIGQAGPETPADFQEAGTSGIVQEAGGGAGCSTGSNVMVCMTPSVKEGTAGQWFILSGVTVSTGTMPSSEPYIIDIMATDATGKVAHGQLPVSVNDGESFTNDKLPPKIMAAVPTGTNKVEVLFSEEISANSVSSSGAEFTITDKDDINQKLGVVSATINAVGTIVTLTTDTQVAGKQYVLTATSGIQDAVGVPLVAGASNRMFFSGFQTKGKIPVIDYVTATGVDTVEVEFQDVIKPSGIKLTAVTGGQASVSGSDVNFEIFEADTGNRLPVFGVSFGDKPNVIIVKTDPQKPNQGYRIQVKGVESYDGKKSDVGSSKAFKGLNLRTVQRQAAGNIGDFDGNGSVDFSDFTIFSSVYGLSYYQNGGGSEETAPETGGQPITPKPDALVPVTSEPAGGELPTE